MADINEAFNCFNTINKNYQNIDYFFTQRNMKENHEYLDKNMNRKNKKVSIVYNFLAINIPFNDEKKEFIINIEIFGDSGYHYKGKINSYNTIVPSFMIPLKGDKKVFVHAECRDIDDDKSINKHYMCFIDVPKRFQSIDENLMIIDENIEEPPSTSDVKV
jgi:hypothetical protein